MAHEGGHLCGRGKLEWPCALLSLSLSPACVVYAKCVCVCVCTHAQFQDRHTFSGDAFSDLNCRFVTANSVDLLKLLGEKLQIPRLTQLVRSEIRVASGTRGATVDYRFPPLVVECIACYVHGTLGLTAEADVEPLRNLARVGRGRGARKG